MDPEKYIFSPASLADVNQLAMLETILFHTDQCSKRSFRYLILHSTVIVVRSRTDDEIFGYAVLLKRKNSSKMRIYSFGIAAHARQNGVGTKLLDYLETVAKKENSSMLTLEVSDQNPAGISLYQKFGFKQYGFKYGYYQDGSHALLIRKHLHQSSIANDYSAYQSYVYQ
jgi:ribosomal protein S18 acetylase RimI-like enzyme